MYIWSFFRKKCHPGPISVGKSQTDNDFSKSKQKWEKICQIESSKLVPHDFTIFMQFLRNIMLNISTTKYDHETNISLKCSFSKHIYSKNHDHEVNCIRIFSHSKYAAIVLWMGKEFSAIQCLAKNLFFPLCKVK